MKAIQLSIDEEWLRRFDALPEVKRHGRSAFIRTIAEQYLAHRTKLEIRAAYRRGYGTKPVRADEFDVEPEALAWPDD
jgi:metal-responsive CopG/Arc/MetJ family transcriptional regulator